MRTALKAIAGVLCLPVLAAYALADAYDRAKARFKRERERAKGRKRRKKARR